MDWRKLYFGHVSPREVQEAVHDEEWQRIRRSMKGTSLLYKYECLTRYLRTQIAKPQTAHSLRMVHVRITNYVTALSRGGLIKKEEYGNA